MNAVIAKLWPIINTDLALPLLDIVEDALKDKYPNLIDTVRIEELDLGVTPFRIVKMKYLDPKERISEGHDVESDSSRFVNMEVDFEYRGENRKVASVNDS
jgi:Ca2+-dependent lipid-binding protein